MFISSYNTYIQPNNQNKIQDTKYKNGLGDSFYLPEDSTEAFVTYKNPSAVDYIRKNNSFALKLQLLQYKEQETQTTQENLQKVSNFKILENAKTAYTDNTKMFSLYMKPGITLNQTPKLDEKLSKDIQELKEKNTRTKMINTYLANDKYFQITAA